MTSERITIESILTCGKTFSAKREKQSDESEKVVAHLKFSALFAERHVLDELVGRPVGWSQGALYDEMGAPIAALEIGLPALVLEVNGTLAHTATAKDKLKLMGAELSGVTAALTKLGVLLSGDLSWPVAGDECTDVEPLLGQLCQAKLTLSAPKQGDLLKAA